MIFNSQQILVDFYPVGFIHTLRRIGTSFILTDLPAINTN